jgi:hypothetical protein
MSLSSLLALGTAYWPFFVLAGLIGFGAGWWSRGPAQRRR